MPCHANIIVGDFHCPDINWYCLTSSANNCDSLTVLNWAITVGYTQFVNFATRGVNTLDLVFSDDTQMISSISYSPPIGHSDHCIVDFLLCIQNTADTNGGTNASTVQYNWHLPRLDNVGRGVLPQSDALASWFAFLDVLWFAVDMFVPHKETRSSADADNRLDAFSGQSRSTNMVPLHM